MVRTGDGNGSTCQAPLVQATPAVHLTALAATDALTIE